MDVTEAIAKSREGDQQAFETLVRAFQGKVFSLIYRFLRSREDAKEFTQETFLRAWQHLGQYNPDYAFQTWLYSIALNLCRDHLRKWRGMKEESLEGSFGKEGSVPDVASSPERDLTRAELLRTLEEAIAALPMPYRSALILKEIEGFSYEEIAQTLQCSIGTVKSRLFRARDIIQRRMAKDTEK